MKSKLISKLIAVTLVSTICFGTFSKSLIVSASVNKRDKVIQQINYPKMISKYESNDIKNEVYKFLMINEDRTIGFVENIPEDLYVEYKLDKLQEHFNNLNDRVKSNEISINPDFSINQIESRGGVTKVVSYWWGASEWYSYDKAAHNAHIASLYAGSLAGVGVITSSFLLIGSIAAGLGSWYWSAFAENLNYVNNGNGQRGVVVDMNWAGVYSIYSQ